MDVIRPGKEQLFRKTFTFSRLYLPILALLVAVAASGCGASSEDQAGGSTNVNQCSFQPLPATDATFQRDITGGELMLGITSATGPGSYAIDFCMTKPHIPGINGVRADIRHTVATVGSSDANLLLLPYETTGGDLIFTEIYVNESGQVLHAVERCDVNDNCTIFRSPADPPNPIVTGAFNTPLNLSIVWDGINTLTYTVIGPPSGSATFTMDTTANPIVSQQLTHNDIVIGVFASGGAGNAVGIFDNVEITTDNGSSWSLHDGFPADTVSFTGGNTWTFIEGLD